MYYSCVYLCFFLFIIIIIISKKKGGEGKSFVVIVSHRVTVMGVRMFCDFLKLRRWERHVLAQRERQESALAAAFRCIPWSGVAMFFFVMIFFGIDLGAGIKHTARQIQEKKEEAAQSVEVQKMQARQWSVEQVKNFREGEIPKPSWAEGGPRGSNNPL